LGISNWPWVEKPGEHEVVAASEAHVEGILDVLTSVASEERWIGTELPFDRNARRLGIQATIERADALVLVALANGVVVGELTLRASAGGQNRTPVGS